jgi:hypothetical protein
MRTLYFACNCVMLLPFWCSETVDRYSQNVVELSDVRWHCGGMTYIPALGNNIKMRARSCEVGDKVKPLKLRSEMMNGKRHFERYAAFLLVVYYTEDIVALQSHEYFPYISLWWPPVLKLWTYGGKPTITNMATMLLFVFMTTDLRQREFVRK